MNQVIPFPELIATATPIAPVADPVRAELVHEMAMHLIAGITTGLDLSDDFDVIRYLKNTPEQYRAKVISFHMDDARYAAQQIVTAAIFGEP